VVPVCPGGAPGQRRRLLVWFDEAGAPDSASLATYVDGDKRHEACYLPEPFDSLDDILSAGLHRSLSYQLQLRFGEEPQEP
jgi:hypothetical protein